MVSLLQFCLLLALSSCNLNNVLSWSTSNKNILFAIPRATDTSFTVSSTAGSIENYGDDVIIDAADATIPKDEFLSKNPYKRFIDPLFTSAHASERKAAVHDEALEVNGGVWKSFFINKSLYATSAYKSSIIRQLTKAESRGHLQNDFPQMVIDVLGADSLIAVKDLQADDSYFKAKKVLVDALSTQNVLNGKMNGIYKELDQLAAHWDAVVDEGSTTVFVKDVSDLTYKVIINAIFGEDAISNQDMETLRKCTAQIGKGLMAFPIRTPILRKVPFLRRFSRALDARKMMRELVEEKIAFKTAQLEKSKVDPNYKFESSGMLDDFILQMDSSAGEFSQEKVISFCVDNTISSIFAGFDTSASLMTNIMLVLSTEHDARELVREELASFNITSIPKNQSEVLDSLPVLKSVLLESYRYRPAVSGTFRKTTVPVVIGNVRIPANSSIRLSNVYGSFSETLYDSPQKLCPLRFYTKNVGIKANGDAHDGKEEPSPNIFGYGKHLCPGQYLAQIEIALVAKQFLTNYEYELVEGQNLRAGPPFNVPKSGLEMRLKRRED